MADDLSRQSRRDRAWMHAALIFALELSKDPSRKVGAVVVEKAGRLSAFGYNGLVAGMPETEENWSRPRKYDIVRHAEENALIIAPFDLTGSTLYCTLKPCHRCLGNALNSGVTRVIYLQDYPYIHENESVFKEFSAMFLEGVFMMTRSFRTDQIVQAYTNE